MTASKPSTVPPEWMGLMLPLARTTTSGAWPRVRLVVLQMGILSGRGRRHKSACGGDVQIAIGLAVSARFPPGLHPQDVPARRSSDRGIEGRASDLGPLSIA